MKKKYSHKSHFSLFVRGISRDQVPGSPNGSVMPGNERVDLTDEVSITAVDDIPIFYSYNPDNGNHSVISLPIIITGAHFKPGISANLTN